MDQVTVLRALSECDHADKVFAAASLPGADGTTEAATPHLIEMIRSPDPDLQIAGLLASQRVSWSGNRTAVVDTILDHFSNLTGNDTRGIHVAVIDGLLAHLPDPIPPRLRLFSPDEQTFESRFPRIVTYLVDAMFAHSVTVNDRASRAFTEICQLEPSWVTSLTPLLQVRHRNTEPMRAARIAVELGADADPIVDEIAALKEHKSPNVRLTAQAALLNIDTEGSRSALARWPRETDHLFRRVRPVKRSG